ncbi:OmpW family outer membrane protein [Glaciimonas sp. CA11.2]|uniref:OmpW/AlkL family protein n=1 Tax=unclassified Glaciimonas TaxID=2644401 RepID=UPI002AB4CBD8|nr:MULTISPECIES: OmpW family outer membrane protein [unclassified Glaciimonas]MDY7546679.1 OmpW family outer membrane protein [Glaciimonas sp. CA11.2]MEB0011804.1 OmpW family outer membrane protein [Glaciimonas sp. Cout2]MEB0080640.1 OmpW family outer membrane protein [Glaciimonas sp. Gout2]MEB0162260.1 OmpW family outer membrane protein [Glaciimonas sp. CA11.2]
MKKHFSVLPKIAALTLLTMAALPAMAQQAGDNIVGLGWFHLAPQDSSQNLSVSGQTIPNTGAGVGNADTLGLQFSHFFTDNWVLSADAGIPPKFKLDGQGILQGTHIGSAKQWSPAVLVKYYFGDKNSQFRPFVGAGATYVWYTDVQLDNGFQQKLSGVISRGQTGALRTSADLSSSLAPVISAGASYNFDAHWSVGLSVSYIPLKTRADLTTSTPSGDVHSTTKLTLDPIVSFLSVGYKF